VKEVRIKGELGGRVGGIRGERVWQRGGESGTDSDVCLHQ